MRNRKKNFVLSKQYCFKNTATYTRTAGVCFSCLTAKESHNFFFFRGTVSVDISLRRIDINQCDAQDSVGLEETKETSNKQTRLNTFMGTHRCKKSTKASQFNDQNNNSLS